MAVLVRPVFLVENDMADKYRRLPLCPECRHDFADEGASRVGHPLKIKRFSAVRLWDFVAEGKWQLLL